MGRTLQFTHILSVCKQGLLQCTQPPSLQRHLFQFRCNFTNLMWKVELWCCKLSSFLSTRH